MALLSFTILAHEIWEPGTGTAIPSMGIQEVGRLPGPSSLLSGKVAWVADPARSQ